MVLLCKIERGADDENGSKVSEGRGSVYVWCVRGLGEARHVNLLRGYISGSRSLS